MCKQLKSLTSEELQEEVAAASFNALECVGKYVEGNYSLRCIQVYDKEILDLLCVEDEEGRIEMARKLERAAKTLSHFICLSKNFHSVKGRS
jgi:hypothetical protein